MLANRAIAALAPPYGRFQEAATQVFTTEVGAQSRTYVPLNEYRREPVIGVGPTRRSRKHGLTGNITLSRPATASALPREGTKGAGTTPFASTACYKRYRVWIEAGNFCRLRLSENNSNWRSLAGLSYPFGP